MEVDDGGLDGGVSEELLDEVEVDALVEEVGCEGVAQATRGCGDTDSGVGAGVLEGLLDGSGGDGPVVVLGGKEPVLGSVFRPVLPEDGQGAFGQQGVTVFASFALADADEHSVAVDVGHFEVSGFVGSEAC